MFAELKANKELIIKEKKRMKRLSSNIFCLYSNLKCKSGLRGLALATKHVM